MSGRILIKKAKAEHISRIKTIETECGLSPWSEADYLCELSREDSIFFIATTKSETESEIGGYLLARLITNQKNINIDRSFYYNYIELFNIGVKTSFRKKGLGKSLLESLIHVGRTVNAEYIILEVRASNHTAVELYNKKGFVRIYERKNLYQNPTESGFGMKLDLLKNVELDMM